MVNMPGLVQGNLEMQGNLEIFRTDHAGSASRDFGSPRLFTPTPANFDNSRGKAAAR